MSSKEHPPKNTNGHNRRMYKQKDARRQQEIENHLGCKFLRIQESDTFDCIKHTINESIGV